MEFGARPLKRIVQAQVETMLARKIIANDIQEGDKVELFYDKNTGGLNTRLKLDVDPRLEEANKAVKEKIENNEENPERNNEENTTTEQ